MTYANPIFTFDFTFFLGRVLTILDFSCRKVGITLCKYYSIGDIKKNLPKGFLYTESLQETLIERSLRLLKEVGIQEVIIGTGYENKAYDALADRLSAKDFKIMTHKNEDFATTGSAYTLWCLRELITQDFLLLESDLVYEPLTIKDLLQDNSQHSHKYKAGENLPYHFWYDEIAIFCFWGLF